MIRVVVFVAVTAAVMVYLKCRKPSTYRCHVRRHGEECGRVYATREERRRHWRNAHQFS